jgi:hypothetical protein
MAWKPSAEYDLQPGEHCSKMIFRCRLLLACILLLAGTAADCHARAQYSRAKHLEGIAREPLVLFLATGGPNACGPGCSQWIAAQGNFDDKSDERFRAFLARVQRYDLPVYFSSKGGLVGNGMKIAGILREHRMTVGVGRTIPKGCRDEVYPGQPCRRQIEKKSEHQARLITKAVRCASACIYALMGGAVRRFAPDVILGVHASGYRDESLHSPQMSARVQLLKRYSVEMGVDPGLIDATFKVPQDRVHILSRGEIAKYGLETKAFETSWFIDRSQDGRVQAVKAWTYPVRGNETQFTTVTLRVGCISDNQIQLVLRRERLPRQPDRFAAFEIDFGEAVSSLGGRLTFGEIETSTRYFAWDDVQRALSRDAIKVAVNFSDATWSRVFTIRTKALVDSMPDLRRSCADKTAR